MSWLNTRLDVRKISDFSCWSKAFVLCLRGVYMSMSLTIIVMVMLVMMWWCQYCLITRVRDVVSGTAVRALVLGHFSQKISKRRFERYGQKTNKNFKKCKGVMLWAADVCSRAAFLLLSLGRLLRSPFSVRVRRKVNLSETPPSVHLASLGPPHLLHSYRL